MSHPVTMTLSVDTGPVKQVIDGMTAWLASFDDKNFADLDDTALAAAAVKLATFATDFAEACEACGLPLPADGISDVLGWADEARAEMDRRIAAGSPA